MNRSSFVATIERKLGSRKLIWCGTRGEDAQPLLVLPQFSEVFSLIAPLRSVSIEVDVCLERLKRNRVDLDTYSLDSDYSASARTLRRRLLDSLKKPAAILPYRPLAFLSSVYYPREGHVDYLGLFHERQAPFEHKPWVETQLRDLGIPTVPWRYFADEDGRRLEDELETRGELVLRTNRSDGGAGLRLVKSREDLVKSREDLSAAKPVHVERFLAAAPVLLPHIPVNVNACVFPDGSVTMHGPSLQLIGIDYCTNRSFGYCGNDFGAIREVEIDQLDQLEDIVSKVGKWLASKGYLGAFGVDAMICGRSVYLAEVNPRFQGSSALSAILDEQLDRVDVFLAHIGAFLGIMPGKTEKLRSIALRQRETAQVIVHNKSNDVARRCKGMIDPHQDEIRYSLLPDPSVRVRKEAILFKAAARRSVTSDGFSLRPNVLSVIQAFMARAFASPESVVQEVENHG